MEINEHLVRAWARTFTERQKKQLALDPHPHPLIVIVCRESPLDGTPLDHESCLVPIVDLGAPGPEKKKRMIEHARALGIAGRAFAAILVTQAWAVMRVGQSPEDAERERAAVGNSLAQHPERREVLITRIEWAADLRVESTVYQVVRDQGFVDFDDLGPHHLYDVTGPTASSVLCGDGPVPPDILQAGRDVARFTCLSTADALKEIRRV